MQFISAPGAEVLQPPSPGWELIPKIENPFSLTRKSLIHRKGEQINCLNTDVRAASGLQRGSTAEVTPQSATTVVLRGLHQLFFTQQWEETMSYRAQSCTKDSKGNHPFLLQWKTNITTFFSSFHDATFNHPTSWGAITEHFKSSF